MGMSLGDGAELEVDPGANAQVWLGVAVGGALAKGHLGHVELVLDQVGQPQLQWQGLEAVTILTAIRIVLLSQIK